MPAATSRTSTRSSSDPPAAAAAGPASGPVESRAMGRLLAGLTLIIIVACAAVVQPILATFRVDASTESLVLENDPDARRYDRTCLTFGSDEFVLVGLTREDLFTPAGVAAVTSLHQEFAAIPGVRSVLSLANAKLLRSFKRPLQPFFAIAKQATIHSPEVDLAKAKEELTTHELYRGNLVDEHGHTAGIVVELIARPEHVEAARRWGELQAGVAAVESAQAAGVATDAAPARRALEEYRPTYVAAENARKNERIEIIKRVRQIVARERAAGQDIDVSGVPSIVVEMVEAIDRDLQTFTVLSVGFIALFLAAVFRRAQWVVLPAVPLGATVLFTLGLMLLAGKQVTVITGNIPSLLIVIGIAHSIHMVVRWREDLALHPEATSHARVQRVAGGLVWPCLFTATTTMVGFGSMVSTGSRPIIDFGVFMAIGVGLAFALSFVAMPGALAVLPVRPEGRMERSARFLEALARAALARPALVVAVALAAAALGVVGIARLDVEARFIDYFSPSSSIHKGLTYIDDRLGGTSGLEVVLEGEQGAFGPGRPENLEKAAKVAEWLRSKEEVGVVMSYTGLLDELRKLNSKVDRRGAGFMLGQALDRGALDAALFTPYVVIHPVVVEGRTVAPFSSVRIVARVKETSKTLRRLPLKAELEAFLAETFPPGSGIEAHPTGMFVLYANMLSSLTGSQVSSSLLCLGAIGLMMAALLRSVFGALLALVPNVLPIVLAIGAMGWAGIPLDMATVMIASVSLGIGIDCAIHYLWRYEAELAKDGDVKGALERTSGSIGTSILYTSLTSVVGFAVLAFSEFRPNAYFGVLTGVAMVAALFAMLTLLPVLVAATRLFERRAIRAAPPPGP